MPFETEFYQIGGFRAQTEVWTEGTYDLKFLSKAVYVSLTESVKSSDAIKETGEALAKSEDFQEQTPAIELILGVLSSGASYVLMSASQMRAVSQHTMSPLLRRPWRGSNFISLSPITFKSADELFAKISTYKQKSGKKGKDTREKGVDYSAANKLYATAGAEVGRSRGIFEQQRLLVRILSKQLSDPGKFSVSDISWSRSVRIMSLVFNSWALDFRPKAERAMEPKLVDIGWTEISPVDLSKKQNAHIEVFENKALKNKDSKKLRFEHGQTEQLNRDAISSRLRKLFKDPDGPSNEPIILLVYDEELTKGVLRYYGLDISTWDTGIDAILEFGKRKERKHESDGPKYKTEGQNYKSNGLVTERYLYDRSGRRRSRSRSPKREQRDTEYPLHRSRSHYSPLQSSGPSSRYHLIDDERKPPLPYDYEYDHKPCLDDKKAAIRHYPPVFIVDVRAMHIALMQNGSFTGLNIIATAERLNVPADGTGFCAGNECHLLIAIWRSMAQDPPIDEQRVLRSAGYPSSRNTPDPSVAVPEEVEAEDFDPNSVTAQPIAPQAYEEEDEEWDADEGF